MAKKRQRKQSESSESSSDSDQDSSKQLKLDSEIETVKEELPRKEKWKNRQRVLVFGCRGLSFRDRHLVRLIVIFIGGKTVIFIMKTEFQMDDLKNLMPHAKGESKMRRNKVL